LGASLNNAFGRPLSDFVEPEPQLNQVMASVRATRQSYTLRDLMFHVREKPGVGRAVDCHVTALDSDNDGPLMLEIQDNTRLERINRENALMVQHDVTRAIMRQLAHEIRNPLGGIRGAAQLLARRMAEESLVEYTRVIIREADRLTALLATMLGPGTPVRRESRNVHELLQHVLRLVAAESPDGIAIRTDYDPSLPRLKLDRDMLIQVFLNLARNAIQAMGTDGVLVMRTRVLNSFTIGGVRHRLVASIEFEDDGRGVPAELGENIFFPLVTSSDSGSGLGLPLAQELVNRHGGLIEFDSRPGRTVFQILLPIDL
jgi:two-component system nitrogen regulation sensor histidine kinase GlnL